MTRRAKYRSDAHEAIHHAASALHRAGAVDKATMRDFDRLSLAVPEPLDPEDIRQIRDAAKVSQSVFARYLNTSDSTVEKWETGAKRPSGMALKLLNIVRKRGIEVLT
jgi:putative transcriptional regulator